MAALKRLLTHGPHKIHAVLLANVGRSILRIKDLVKLDVPPRRCNQPLSSAGCKLHASTSPTKQHDLVNGTALHRSNPSAHLILKLNCGENSSSESGRKSSLLREELENEREEERKTKKKTQNGTQKSVDHEMNEVEPEIEEIRVQ